jgi:hypothetical protein
LAEPRSAVKQLSGSGRRLSIHELRKDLADFRQSRVVSHSKARDKAAFVLNANLEHKCNGLHGEAIRGVGLDNKCSGKSCRGHPAREWDHKDRRQLRKIIALHDYRWTFTRLGMTARCR